MLIEGAAAVAVVGLLECASGYEGKNVAVVLGGSNISSKRLAAALC
jgi:threonine dehydratase